MLSIDRILAGHQVVMQQGVPITEVAKRYKVSPATVTRGCKRAGVEWVH
jgi:DNA-binding MurR/RpiR family transcriptional regulator